jgi:hypothetical protein
MRTGCAPMLRRFVQIRISTSSAGRPPRRYEEPVVGWFRSDECWLHSLLAIRSDRTRREVTADYLPFGLNYALRRSVQLIPTTPISTWRPGQRQGGEETDVGDRPTADGFHWPKEPAVAAHVAMGRHGHEPHHCDLSWLNQQRGRSAGTGAPTAARGRGRTCLHLSPMV